MTHVDKMGAGSMGGEMTHEDIELDKSAQRRVAGLVVGIMSLKPGDDDPAVQLGLRNLETGDTEQGVFVPGVAQQMLGHTVEVVSITHEPAQVLLRVGSREVAR